ncbi:MAG: hypothetical protein M3Z98_08340 [Candidatus Dormibacteraeota bacterium]|nr:hypothetical protein [Candidatus Dormibacteraeota bacterium]
MPLKFARVRALLMDVPRNGKLGYCLLRDDRVPMAPKVALVGALGVIVSPLDLPAWIPVVGELDMLALGILAVKVFVESCPDELVREHSAAIKAGTSRFDRDRRALQGGARRRAASALGRAWEARPHRNQDDLEDESA